MIGWNIWMLFPISSPNIGNLHFAILKWIKLTMFAHFKILINSPNFFGSFDNHEIGVSPSSMRLRNIPLLYTNIFLTCKQSRAAKSPWTIRTKLVYYWEETSSVRRRGVRGKKIVSRNQLWTIIKWLRGITSNFQQHDTLYKLISSNSDSEKGCVPQGPAGQRPCQSHISQVPTLNTDYLLWHTQLIVCTVKYQYIF